MRRKVAIVIMAIGCFFVGCKGNWSHNGQSGTGASASQSIEFAEEESSRALESEKAEEILATTPLYMPTTCENEPQSTETNWHIDFTTLEEVTTTEPSVETTTTTIAETTPAATTTPVMQTTPAAEYVLPISTDEQILLLKTASCEAGGQGVYGLCLVMRCIINRAELFGCSITDVIYAPNQFAVVGNELWNNNYIVPDSYVALNLIMNGWNESQGALYFCTPKANAWHSANLVYLFTYLDHEFYK